MMHGKDILGGSDAAIGLRINASIFENKKKEKRKEKKRKEKKRKEKKRKEEKETNIVVDENIASKLD